MTIHTLSIQHITHKKPTRRAKYTAYTSNAERLRRIRHAASSVVAAVLVATLGACSDSSRTAPTPENITPIEDVARRDAQRVMSAPDARECERILLDIRAKEYALRHKGYVHSADIYIEAVRATLDTVAIDAL